MGKVLNVWEDDFWSLNSLTDSINVLPYVPSMCEELGIFQVEGVATVAISAEYKDGNIYLVPNKPRGAPGTPNSTTKRVGRSFETLHLPLTEQVLAESVQGIRRFGSDNETETVQMKANDKLAEMKQHLNATKEYHRIGAITGKLLDSDGTTELLDLFSEFSITEPTQDFDFSSDADDVRVQCMTLTRTIQAALAGMPMTRVGVFCSDSWFDELISHSSVKDTYKYHSEATALRTNLAFRTFEFAGCLFVNYRGSVSSVDFIEDDYARAFPMGAPGLFKEYYAPANYEQTVNTIGLPFYASSERMPHNKGRELEAQSNPLMLCHRPSTLIKLSMTTT
jgi:hypothetical protein